MGEIHEISAMVERMTACAKQKQFAFVVVFVSKSVPECWACILSPGNPILEEARDRIETAFDSYRDLRERYGTKPWPQDWKLSELHVEDVPGGNFGWE